MLGSGHVLGSEQTLAIMETEYLYPDLSDRSPPDVWQEAGSPDIRDRARAQVRQILSSHFPSYIDPEADARIRERFPIVLPPEDMDPECGRW